MRVTAIYNPEAGPRGMTRQRLARLLDRAGYDATYVSAKGKRWKGAVENAGDLVVVAGGDGTTAKVAKRLAGRGVPMAILPAGTANNIARSLGLDRPLEHLVAGWIEALPAAIDLGLARGPWGEELFVEAWGLNVFPRMLERAAAIEKMPPAKRSALGPSDHGIHLMIELVRSSPARHWSVMVDDDDLSGKYILLEAMNIRYIGAAMELAPSADATDGALDVIAIREEERDAFAEYLRELERGMKPRHEFTKRARRIEIRGAETLTHIDDEAWPERDEAGDSDHVALGRDPIVIEVLPGAVEVLM